ncbi:MAG: tripartite tricarboxylate transporter TctB family protein [Lachnospiraceae bacterium]|nr:tripartite tricarboxylate transporter TctB family protein [Lachnospiraceae bacterium]
MNDIYGNDEKLNLNQDNAQDVGEDIRQNENRDMDQDMDQNDILENERTNPGKSKGVFVWLGIFAGSFTSMLLMIGLEKILKLYDISYRSWLEQLICGMLIFLVPIFFFILLETALEQWKRTVTKKIVYFLSSVLQILVIGIGGFYIPVAGFFYLLTYESTFETEHLIKDSKGNAYIEGVTSQFLGGSEDDKYAYYTPVMCLMKKRYTDETNIIGMKLEKMYDESFTVQNVDGNYTAIPVNFPEITIHVKDSSHYYAFMNDYEVQRGNYWAVQYLEQNCPQRRYEMRNGGDSAVSDENGELYIICEGMEDIDACAEDVSNLWEFVMKDSFFKERSHYVGVVVELYVDGKETDMICGIDNTNIENSEINIRERMRSIYASYEGKQTGDSKTDRKDETEIEIENSERTETETPEKSPDSQTNGTLDSAGTTDTANGMDGAVIDAASDPGTPEGAYFRLYNAVFKDDGDAYQPTYNAKGNFYAVLDVGSEEVDGETQNYRRTVVYDRESKNGACLLFVAYKEYTCFDGSTGNTAILNFYGVDKKTGKVIAADKTAWADVGCKAYRDMTGE